MKNVNKKTPSHLLDEIKPGDIIRDETGKIGEVVEVEVINRKMETQYYYKTKNNGTVLVIK
ncbi:MULTISPECIES: hypothetical protein [unclassified Pedobacter]|jgi:hypothetical protein|uniref:hypothetical protein n=1 Tax=Pedobacter TaxID=84567 RepID=UPI000B4C033A|nr:MULTISPECIES: hypothetical protein [unclassified Pedobacter]MCX2429481.1 hypothetical protein [Pedobacter sp. GR22-10]MCX2586338.1 hypothetical protein [Pedobacter sp. MR22-3]OWK70887.1 hypothetical protein CBW18_07280 [Pedobacter sp. AJM]